VPKPAAVLEELHVDFGKAIADLVALFDSAHCFEIKGSTDKVERVLAQEQVFSRAFLRLTLVTTSNHVDWAKRYVPSYWGIVVASHRSGRVILSRLRPSGQSPNFSKEISLRTMWRPELVELASRLAVPFGAKDNKIALAEKIAAVLSKRTTAQHVSATLKARVTAQNPST